MSEKNISMNKLSSIINVPVSTIQRNLTGETKKFSSELEYKIRTALNISPNEISEIITENIKNNAIENMDFKTTNNSCNICTSQNKVKDMQLGRNNQIVSISICSECRKKLIYKLMESLDI